MNDIVEKNKSEYLTEKQLSTEMSPIAVDLDLHFDYSLTERIYSQEHLDDLVDVYLAELKELMGLGVVDDIAVLAETDIKNKENIVKRKSLYSQLQGQIQQLSEANKDQAGTIETLERQLVQAGIKQKVMQADVEINKKKEEVKSQMGKQYVETEGKQKLLRNVMANNVESQKQQTANMLQSAKNSLDSKNKNV